MTIAAIETRYAGCRFRSRLEARWAVFFDTLGIRWEYEPQGFNTSEGAYLPDFLLPDLDKWVEVKGGDPSESDVRRVTAFAHEQWQQGFRFTVLQGDVPRAPEFHPELGPLGVPVVMWTALTDHFTGNTSHPLVGEVEGGDTLPTLHYLGMVKPGDVGDEGFIDAYWLPAGWERLPAALTAARSARFEHGERG